MLRIKPLTFSGLIRFSVSFGPATHLLGFAVPAFNQKRALSLENNVISSIMVVDLSAGISLSPPTVHQGNCSPNYTRTSLIIVLVWFYILLYITLVCIYVLVFSDP